MENFMKTIKNLIITSLIGFSTITFSDVVEVYTWKAKPGKDAELIQLFRDAAVIHENEGATVAMEVMNVGDTMGTYQYVMRWDNLVDWGISKDKLNTSAEWTALGEKYTPGELGEMTSSLSGVNLDSTVKASDFSDPFVYSVQVWDPTPGKIQELLSNFMMAKSMIEATGARVEIYSEGTGGNGKFHYVLLHENWTKMGEVYAALGSSEEWLAFQSSTAQGNAATLVSSHSGQVIQ
tara:strand:+ start:857 stop:1564 length:708 start_codon:yes stop_codon:yes gene_type:complete